MKVFFICLSFFLESTLPVVFGHELHFKNNMTNHRDGCRINLRVPQNFTKKTDHRNDVICRKICGQVSLNFMAFSGGFWLHTPVPLTHYWHPHFWYIKGIQLVHIWAKFHSVWFVVLEFWNFKCFHTSRRYNFRLLLGGFLDVTHCIVIKFVCNFDQWCSAT